jgi:hypothetical protein
VIGSTWSNPGRYLRVHARLELRGNTVYAGGDPLADVIRRLYAPELYNDEHVDLGDVVFDLEPLQLAVARGVDRLAR